MKRILAVILSMILVAMVACGCEDDGKNKAETTRSDLEDSYDDFINGMMGTTTSDETASPETTTVEDTTYGK